MFITLGLFAQVSINTDGSPAHSSAMLEVKSDVRGFLPPRVALSSITESAPIASPVALGLLVFNTATAGDSVTKVVPGYYYWQGTKWMAVATPQGTNPGDMLFWNGFSWETIPSGSHGQQLHFCHGLPKWGGCDAEISTLPPTDITQSSAVSGGNVLADGGSYVFARGVCWSQDPNPTIENDKTYDGYGTGVFISNVTGLIPNTLYHLRAYATNSVGTAYGDDSSFVTSEYSGAPITSMGIFPSCPGSAIEVPVTVGGFTDIGSVMLTLHYDTTVLTYTGATNTSGFPGLSFNGSVPGEITISGASTYGVTYQGITVLFTLNFNYADGSALIEFFDNGSSCQYLDGYQNILNDFPTSLHYINGYVHTNGEVGIPVFTLGATSSRCLGAATITYTATADNATGITYSLDTNSVIGGNTIDPNTGEVNFTATWASNSVITASAQGCNGPKTSQHTVTVDPLLPVSVSITASDNPVCAGTPVEFYATYSNGGQTPVCQWKVNGNNVGDNSYEYIYSPANGDLVTCTLISSILCTTGNPATSNPITMTVNQVLPVSVSISTPNNPVCAGSLVVYTATPVNGGTNPSYQWLKNGSVVSGATNATYYYSPVNVDQISCILNSTVDCPTGNPDTSNVITMGIDPLLPVSVSITASDNPVCAGVSVTFTAIAANGGTAPSYQWKVNGNNAGTNSTLFMYIPVNNDMVTCVVTSGLPCVSGNPATSNEIIMGVIPQLAVGSIGSDQTIEMNGIPAELTGVPPSNGTLPVYQMQSSTDNIIFTDIAGATTLNYQPGALTVTTYYRQMQNASGTCGGPMPTNVVTITVNDPVYADVSISADPQGPVCAGTEVTFTAVPVNGGTAPAYQWKVNGNNAGTNSPTFIYNPQDGDMVLCVMTSNLPNVLNNPVNSNMIEMTVNPLLPASVSNEANPSGAICAGTLVIFTATPVNGGTAPAYQWMLGGNPIPGATNSTYSSPTLGNGTVISVVMTSNASPCVTGSPATSNEIVMIVDPILPASVSIAADPTGAICAGTSVTFTATPTNGGTAPAYQWMLNGNPVSGETNSTYTSSTLGDGRLITVVMNSNAAPCLSGSPATSNQIEMVVNPEAPVSITITPSANPVCSGIPVIFTSSIVNGGTAPLYQWKLNGANVSGATNANYTCSPADGNTISCVLTSNASCTTGNPATSNVVTMTVDPAVPVSASITASLYAVMPGTQVTYTATVVNGGTAPVYQWKVNTTNVGTNSTTYAYTPANGDKISCVITSNSTASCLSNNPATSNIIVAVVYTTGTACPGLPTIDYNGLIYNTVQIGNQCWLRENLNIGTMINNTVVQTNNGITEKYCYNDTPINCDVYGGLYQWNELMQYVTTQGAQGICPSGWHVPTEAEFITLATYVGGASTAGGKLKEAGTGHFNLPNTGATNEYGFTALPSGYSYNNTMFSNIKQAGYFYTSTDVPANGVVFRSVASATASLGTYFNYRTTGNPVRCLKN